MKPFADLSSRGQRVRLKKLATEALRSYSIRITRITHLAYHNNATFRLRDARGSQYVLRINRPLFHNAPEIESETAWTSDLTAHTGIQTPQVVRARSGTAELLSSFEVV